MFPLDSHETCFLSSLDLFLEACRIWTYKGHIFLVLFDNEKKKPKISSKVHFPFILQANTPPPLPLAVFMVKLGQN